MRLFLFILIISVSSFAFAQMQQSICTESPEIKIHYYLFDYSGGAESSDDSRFRGQVTCETKVFDGIFSFGEQTGRLYFFIQSTNNWTLLY